MKTAVVVIHGIGEQWPMDTLRGFVEAAWSSDPEIIPPGPIQIYSKPDQITGSFELRRITTRLWSGANGRRADFFEFYWAHLMQGNSLSAVVGWLIRLLIRSPARVPRRLLLGWLFGLVVLIGGATLVVFAQMKPEMRPFDWPPLTWALIAAGGGLFSTLWLRPAAGDAARYLSPAPGNVASRQAIREAGIELLTKIKATGDYDRIIVAGHSLGAVIGYDVLNYAWGRIAHTDLVAGHVAQSVVMTTLTALEAAADKLVGTASSPNALTAYREAQRAYFAALSKLNSAKGEPLWLVSDFVTLGCPLSKADVLLGKDETDLNARKALREAPTDPPRFEQQKPPRFSYPADGAARTPHHAAVFGPTVWTNIFYPTVLGAIGDFISGPVASQLGRGVRDVRVPIGFPSFRHLSYWSNPAKRGPNIRALRRALNLRGHTEATLWGAQADVQPVRAEALSERIVPVPAPKAGDTA
ncbi:hypothetical protein ASD76_16880 [Altererythrobacter sp. Root672]|nr:hypothetical protein ASD76_16880 [Altererythrobacter sp. Root672]